MTDLEHSSTGDFKLRDWLVQPSLNRISRGDSTITLELKWMNVLVCLAEQPGELVTRQEIIDEVWATEFITDNTLTHTIAELRNVLGDDAVSPRFIETIRRRGYRLVAPVERVDEESEQPDSLSTDTTERPKWQHFLALGIAAIIAVLVVLPPEALFQWRGEGTTDERVPRIVVLPFENLGSPEDEYFADGMTDEVRSRLTYISGLEVIAWASASQYKNTTKTVDVVARELGVSYLLMSRVRRQEGSVEGGRIRVTSELVEVPDSGVPISKWQVSFEDQLQDVFRVQTEIATKVAEGLQVALKTGERIQLSSNPTTDVTAYDAFLRGEALVDFYSRWDVPVSVWRNAARHYEYAISLEPSFALSWARLSRCRTLVYINGSRMKSDADGALTAAERALSIAPDHPAARYAMAYYHLLVKCDAEKSRRVLEQGFNSNPGDADLVYLLGLTQLFQGNWLDAVNTFERARALDPRSTYGMWILGRTHLRMRNYSEALVYLDLTLAHDPTQFHAIRDKIRAFVGQGDLEQARRVVSDSALHTDLPTLMANLADMGWILDEEMQEIFLRLRPASFDNDVIAWGVSLADLYGCRGEFDKAVKYANKAQEGLLERTPGDPYWKTSVFRALALAYRGNRDEAIHEAQRGVAMVPIDHNGYFGPNMMWVLAKVLIIAGEYEKALDSIEILLRVPCEISSGWLRVDPHVDPLRGHPRFQALLEKYDTVSD